MNRFAVSFFVGAAAVSSAFAGDVVKLVKADFADYGSRSFVHYAVPAMSEVQRLPDAYPTDGKADAPVRIFAAKGEYEPGSFEVWGVRDLGKVSLELGEFKDEKGVVFPKEDLDLKLVKCWYQNLNGWFSYFADCGDCKLCPELLVNDEDLIRCDEKKKANYAKIVGPDGKVRERWINPPKEVANGENEAFKPMAPGFADAATLQPVRLPKEQFRNFFLTVKTTKDTPAGVYRGEIKLVKGQKTVDGRLEALGSIPVEIHVADYELPHPKGFKEPERDFLVSMYHHFTFRQIASLNGGDLELAIRQNAAMLRDMAKHGQTMYYPGCPYPDPEFYKTLDLVVESGLRPDVFMGVLVPWTKPEDFAALPKRLAAELDRRYGHHNLYTIYGDEPTLGGWLEKELVETMEAWQACGLKFALAGEDCVFRKVGFGHDWGVLAIDPTIPNAPLKEKWAKQPGARYAWYANQHVGPENPALNRRQNGLAPWLNGYNSLCNYAHHLGPYNDNACVLYRPMVYAYGTHDGVLDTIQWEGFREGIDDVRYATLLCQLARKAKASSDVKTRHLGGKAFQYLALLDPSDYSADTVRAEMRRMIDGLLAVAKPDPVALIVAPAKKPAAADALLQAELAQAKTDAERIKAYRKYYRWEEAVSLLEKGGSLADAAKAATECLDFARADRIREKLMRDAKANLDQRKKAAWDLVFRRPELWKDKEVLELLTSVTPTAAGTNQYLGAWRTYGILEDGRFHPARYRESFRNTYRLVAKVADAAGAKGMGRGAARAGIVAFAEAGDRKAVAEIVARYLSDEKVKPADRYAFGMLGKLFSEQPKDVASALAAYEKANLTPDLKKEQRFAAIDGAGRLADELGDEKTLRGIVAYRQSLLKPEPRRQYTVRFSELPLDDEGAWTDARIDEAVCDRKYGGSTELLESDVTTGNRVIADKSKEKFPPMRFKVAADEWGIHIRFESFDPRAHEFGAHQLNGGNMEGYIAPGKNRPYVCFFKNDADDAWTIFNTCYNAAGQQHVRKDMPEYLRARRIFGQGKMVHHLAFAWDNFVNDLPKNGSVWDFEPLYWGRTGESSWNGVKTIHGRSTWGELVFELSDAERAKILRHVEQNVFWRFRRETEKTQGLDRYEGLARHWNDRNVGDIAFWNEVVKPYITPLLDQGRVLGEGASDKTVLRLADDGILAKWQNLQFDLDRKRREWLEK